MASNSLHSSSLSLSSLDSSLVNNGNEFPNTTSEDSFSFQISEILGLDDSVESQINIKQLQINGRQGLISIKDEIAPAVYNEQMNNKDSELLQLLKRYYEQQWQSIRDDWFQIVLRQQKVELPEIYEQILIRAAEYGSKYLKDDPIFSLVVQFLFELDDDVMKNETELDNIWKTLLSCGCQGLKHYTNDLSPAVIQQQLTDDSSSLAMALRQHYRQPLNDLLKKECKITDKFNLFEIALNCVVQDGWWKGLNDQKVKNLIPPKKFAPMLEKLKSYMNDNHLSLPEVANPAEIVLSENADGPPVLPSAEIVNPPSVIPAPTPAPQLNPSEIFLPQTQSPPPPPVQQILNEGLEEEKPLEEISLIFPSVDESEKMRVSNLVQAGELMYINKKRDDILSTIVRDFRTKKHFLLFIEECLIPLMYLLKRHQNLDDFMEALSFKLSQVFGLSAETVPK
ncbi:unnamed protein product, partial [Didymodactylos carnosus]